MEDGGLLVEVVTGGRWRFAGGGGDGWKMEVCWVEVEVVTGGRWRFAGGGGDGWKMEVCWVEVVMVGDGGLLWWGVVVMTVA